MLNGSSEWSPLSAARTVSDGNLANDENHEDEVSTLATTKARQIKREIIRRNVDEEENAQAGIRSIYKFGKTLGKGSFAIVKEAEHKETGALVAVKIIDKVDEDKFEEREICALGKINHPNCVALLEVYESSRKLYLVTELMTGGTVMDRIIAQNHFSEKDTATVMVDVLHAVQYLHNIGLVHRDLKLVDFGFAKSFRHVPYMKTQCGSPWSVAPEVLDPDLEHKDGYGPEVDLWSVGVILYSMLCGFPPFYSENNTTLIRQIRRAEYKFHSPYWDEVSFGAKDLVASLLVANPCRRFTSHQCLEHPWVKNAVDASSQKLHSSYRSFILLRKLAIFGNMEPACLEEVSSRLQAVAVPPGEWVIRAGEAGDAMYFINSGAVQIALEGIPVDRLGAGNFFGELALTSTEERCADVVSLGATSGVRCDADGSPVGRRRADPTELFRLTRADFEDVVGRFPALKERLHRVGIARVARACSESPKGSPLRSLYQRGLFQRGRNARAMQAAAAAGAVRAGPTIASFSAEEGGPAAGSAGLDSQPSGPPAPGEADLRERRASDQFIEGRAESAERITRDRIPSRVAGLFLPPSAEQAAGATAS